MHVIATAGHVDHGKSALVRALTGMEPDRWEEERRRGLTIDLGFVWAGDLAFVDVPGHERFLSNTLAGLGPASVVLFVVAADEGWQRQSADHRDAIAALGISHGVIAVTKSDLAPDADLDPIREEFAGTGLADAPIVRVSAKTGAGIEELRAALREVVPQPPRRPLRYWVDRCFSVKGAGTVVTGTLECAHVAAGDQLVWHDGHRPHAVTVRGIQSENQQVDSADPVARVALNLRGGSPHRGHVLVRPDQWVFTRCVDARVVFGSIDQAPEHLVVHVGTAEIQARLRPLGNHARLVLESAVPLRHGDRLVLRAPGGGIVAGVEVADVEPPELARRGAAARRGAQLAAGLSADGEVARRGAVRHADFLRLGFGAPHHARDEAGWWIDPGTFDGWVVRAQQAVAAADPLNPAVSRGSLHVPEELIDALVAAAGLETSGGLIRKPGAKVDLGGAEKAVATVEGWLDDEPFAAPEADELAELKLGPRQLAAAAQAGRLLRLPGEVILLPDAPRRAAAILAKLEQPFTLSQARKALDTTRRVAVPLLEYLDGQGLTRWDGNVRTVR
ncbi:SelB domain-containing protein [Corynebacterium uberis]|uniref:SelB domain-containing protein n=1 Tax=Corynebacterium TaxID=1716 RepID=UPI001D0B91A1|nr:MULTISPECIES: SelB C-terminal domain-containing protein [Corynebacterium]MCZ9308916.1 SelB C-terminal domain-containing protein [Corynebacterium sp. c6VSa_13]UDL74611.1 SelB C-terminal domain-containing protein [Corynebacterium uberis]UDL76555.1 SelB C-terminal domain-containing protein [Corynebacterium uberis]UDL78768.1 SelB C-terminal domain-containing protein [Corynebacterium uberis]UDL81046.1 SelB C-terminal domain-containing protein [Corynebacterium uberis]